MSTTSTRTHPQRVACTRPSTLAKTLTDSFGLTAYGAATTLEMLALHDDLRNRLTVIEPGTWRPYKALHEQAQQRRGKPEAEQGTNIHMTVAALFRGRVPAGLDPTVLRDAENVLDALDAHGLEVVDSEQFVVALDTFPEPLAGTYDLKVRNRRTKALQVVDLKTTASEGNAKYRAMEWAIQLACYGHGLPYSGEPGRDRWERPVIDPALVEMPAEDVDTSVGYVVEVVRGSEHSPITVHEIDLGFGLAAGRLACEVRAARKAYPIVGSERYEVED